MKINSLDTVELWLSATIKNLHYFQSDLVRNDRDFRADYRVVLDVLKDSISSEWTREEYLNWVRIWRLVYSKVATESVMSKWHRKTKDKSWSTDVAIRNTYNVEFLAGMAIWLLSMRAESKEMAEVAYTAKKSSREFVAA